LKRFAAWATAWQERYEADVFLRATVSIVILLAALVLVCVTLFWFVLHFTNQAVVHAIIQNIRAIVVGGSTPAPLQTSIQSIQTASVWYVFLGLVAVAGIFGFLFARFMLWPTRNALYYQKLFISNVAHELRTPLSVIKTSTEVALLDEELPQPMQETLGEIVLELDRISEIINNLLSLDSMTRPERMQLGNVELGPLIDAALERLRLLAREREVTVVVEKDIFGVVWGNATALEQVITNLIKNAINYTQRGAGKVTISIHPNYRGFVVFSVADNGIGISQKDLVHVFEPFYRADTSRVRDDIRKSGSGLGLTIVNEIVRAHHGKIHIQSTRNQGTTVSVLLPVGAQKDGPPLAQAAGESEISLDFSNGLSEISAPQTEETSARK